LPRATKRSWSRYSLELPSVDDAVALAEERVEGEGSAEERRPVGAPRAARSVGGSDRSRVLLIRDERGSRLAGMRIDGVRIDSSHTHGHTVVVSRVERDSKGRMTTVEFIGASSKAGIQEGPADGNFGTWTGKGASMHYPLRSGTMVIHPILQGRSP